MTGRNILVTGGAGFIGRRLVAALKRSVPAARIWVVDNLHPQVHGSEPGVPDELGSAEFVLGDVADEDCLQQVVSDARPDLVYHLAAETGTGQSHDEPTRYCRANVIGTTRLIDAVRMLGEPCRVVLAGSRAVYGEGGYRDADGREFVGRVRSPEAMQAGDFGVPLPPSARQPAVAIPSHAGLPPAPASIYASSKLMQEHLLIQAGEGEAWDAVVLRLQNVYGPGQSLHNPYTGVLSIFARQLLQGETLAIYEDGKIARDFIFVDDVVRALISAGTTAARHGRIADIGLGSPVTILDAARLLMRGLGVDTESLAVTGQFRAGDVRHACADIRVAGEWLGWSPKVGIAEGLQQLADWARSEYTQGRLGGRKE